MAKAYKSRIEIKSGQAIQAIDITREITAKGSQAGIKQGTMFLHVPHSTAGLILNEAESGLLADLEKMASLLLPDTNWQHDKIDNNASSHLLASLAGSSLSLIWSDFKPLLGRWQSIIFLELDGPRTRTVHLFLSPVD